MITHFPDTIIEVDNLINQEFVVIEKSAKGEQLVNQDRFGYKSVHYLVKIAKSRTLLSEYKRFDEKIVEIQVRTILQHAWAEIEHDIQYKTSFSIPSEIKRRFIALAGMLEISDREFQSIQGTDRRQSELADANVKAGKFEEVEITPRALRSYLNRKFGPDGRMSDWNYEWATGNLKKLGFSRLEQVDVALSGYDNRHLSIFAEGSQLGQLGRFEPVLLAAMGNNFIERHAWGDRDWFKNSQKRALRAFENSAVTIGNYDPLI